MEELRTEENRAFEVTIYTITYGIQLLEGSWCMRGSPTMLWIGSPLPFVIENFVLLIFRYQQAMGKI